MRFRLSWGLDDPSSGIPPRSRAKRPLERGLVSIESRAPPRASFHLAQGRHGPAASIPAPPVGAFNALTFAGAQVKGESASLRVWELCPGTAPPTPVGRPSPPLCDAVRHGQQQPRGTRSRTADAPHPRKRTAEPSKRRRTTTQRPCRDNVVTSGRWDRSPPSPSALCDHPRGPRRHPGHCITIPDAVEACGDRTPPRQQLYPRTASCHGTLESSHGRPPNRRHLHRHPQSRSWTRTGHAMMPRQEQDSPGRPSTPRRCTPRLYT
jgi:hypothetical protein